MESGASVLTERVAGGVMESGVGIGGSLFVCFFV